MAKRIGGLLLAVLTLWFCAAPASAALTVERNEGEMYFPDENNWVYHFVYAYPRVVGDDYTAALINDTYQMALDEMTRVVLPMFANAPEMRFDGKNEIKDDFAVVCNDGRLLSIVLRRAQTMGDGTICSLEPMTFDVGGMYAGESMTLRGTLLIQAGVDPLHLEEASPEEYPEIVHIIQGSSFSIAEALTPVLYDLFLAHPNLADAEKPSYEAFETEFLATSDFAAVEEGGIAFYYPPMLAPEENRETMITLSPAETEAILAAAPAHQEETED